MAQCMTDDLLILCSLATLTSCLQLVLCSGHVLITRTFGVSIFQKHDHMAKLCQLPRTLDLTMKKVPAEEFSVHDFAELLLRVLVYEVRGWTLNSGKT